MKVPRTPVPHAPTQVRAPAPPSLEFEGDRHELDLETSRRDSQLMNMGGWNSGGSMLVFGQGEGALRFMFEGDRISLNGMPVTEDQATAIRGWLSSVGEGSSEEGVTLEARVLGFVGVQGKEASDADYWEADAAPPDQARPALEEKLARRRDEANRAAEEGLLAEMRKEGVPELTAVTELGAIQLKPYVHGSGDTGYRQGLLRLRGILDRCLRDEGADGVDRRQQVDALLQGVGGRMDSGRVVDHAVARGELRELLQLAQTWVDDGSDDHVALTMWIRHIMLQQGLEQVGME